MAESPEACSPHPCVGALPTPATETGPQALPTDEQAPDVHSASPGYEARFSGRGGRYLLERQTAGLRRLLHLTGGESLRVLDVGGGHLQAASVLLSLGCSVVLHGSRSEALARLVELPAGDRNRVEARLGPLWRLPSADGEFDLVVSLRVLAHVSWWREMVAEMARASRRFMVLEFPSQGGFQRLAMRLFTLKLRLEGNTRTFSTYSVAAVSQHLEDLGFTVVAIDRQFVLPVVIHRVLAQPALSRLAERLLASLGLTARIGSPVLLLAERDPGGGHLRRDAAAPASRTGSGSSLPADEPGSL